MEDLVLSGPITGQRSAPGRQGHDRASQEYGRGMELLLLVAGPVSVVLLIAWRIRGYQRDVDELDQGEYRPPPIHGQAGPH
jgi:hypothetical protein